MSSSRDNGRFSFARPMRVMQVRPAAQAARPARAAATTRRGPPPIHLLRVVPHGKGWALMVDDLDEPAWVVSRKSSAVKSARDAARFHSCRLRIRTRAGKLERELDFAGGAS